LGWGIIFGQIKKSKKQKKKGKNVGIIKNSFQAIVSSKTIVPFPVH
jgi:hypothetical protein